MPDKLPETSQASEENTETRWRKFFFYLLTSISSRRALTSCANPLLNILWCLSSFLKTTYSDFALRRFFLLLERCPAHGSRIPCGSQLAASLQKEVQELVENRWISQVFFKDSIEKLFIGFRKPIFSNISALSQKNLNTTVPVPPPNPCLLSALFFFFPALGVYISLLATFLSLIFSTSLLVFPTFPHVSAIFLAW